MAKCMNAVTGIDASLVNARMMSSAILYGIASFEAMERCMMDSIVKPPKIAWTQQDGK